MTGRRKSNRKGSARKDSPEKSSRRSSRRRPKSESESESEASADDQESATQNDMKLRKNEASTSIDTSKEDESGGSDGAWHVRSENGNKGGIPKLKLCLSRPSETVSPTSESLPSPKQRRSKRGATDSPSKMEEAKDFKSGEVSTAIDEMQVEVESEQIVQETPQEVVNVTQPSEKESEEVERIEASAEEIEEPKPKSPEVEAAEMAVEEESGKKEEMMRRSPSRDSSEERAKEAALNSRKRKDRPVEKVEEGSEDGEVVESPEREISFPSRVGPRIRTTGSSGSTEQPKEVMENQDEKAPVVRKRRWGSSGTRATTKAPVVISTDILKEIIPEAKPVAPNEVQLSPNRDEDLENGDVENRSRRHSRTSSAGLEERPVDNSEQVSRTSVTTSRKRRDIPSDESEKDYEDGGLESGGEDGAGSTTKRSEPAKETNVNHEEKNYDGIAVTRKISVLPSDSTFKKLRSPSPARHPVSSVLFITNLVRPFTVPQLKDLLARTGTLVEDGFWIDKIKSMCYVKYSSEEEAVTTRNALHKVRWPASNPKELEVEYATEEALKRVLEDGKVPAPLRDIKPSVRHVSDERNEKVRDRDRERERNVKPSQENRMDERERKVRLTDGKDHSERTVRRVTIPVREWDLGKNERGFSPPPFDGPRRFDKNAEDDYRKRDRGREKRSSSEEPYRKVVRKDEPTPAKLLLEDIFRKTKTIPSIYWLPLSAEQIAVREEMRRKHMAEHEKKMAEARKRREVKRKRASHSRTRSPK